MTVKRTTHTIHMNELYDRNIFLVESQRTRYIHLKVFHVILFLAVEKKKSETQIKCYVFTIVSNDPG